MTRAAEPAMFFSFYERFLSNVPPLSFSRHDYRAAASRNETVVGGGCSGGGSVIQRLIFTCFTCVVFLHLAFDVPQHAARYSYACSLRALNIAVAVGVDGVCWIAHDMSLNPAHVALDR